jgi:sugar phosphate isomerase/epimerase
VKVSRRRFLGDAGCTALMAAGSLHALSWGADEPGRIPIGLELYTVDEAMKEDFAGTLRKVAEIGYREVEFPWYHGRSAAEIAAALEASGLTCRSGLFTWEELESDLPARIAFASALGVKYMGCVMMPLPEAADLRGALGKLSLDDFKRYTDRFNAIGARVRKEGLQFTYHNHDFEFLKFNGVVGYDELLRLTDPKLVQMEMDVGWVAWAGYDPARYLREHPGRTALLHIRDLKRDVPYKPLEMHSVEIGRGVIDWKELLAAARTSGVDVGYVEQDPGQPPVSLESAGISLQYLHELHY